MTKKDKTHLPNNYVRALRSKKLMSPSQELESARNIENLKIKCWKILLVAYSESVDSFSEVQELLLGKLPVPTEDLSEMSELLACLDCEADLYKEVKAKLEQSPKAWSSGLSDSLNEAERARDEAKKEFVCCNLRLVISVARKYNKGGLPFIDIIQEGNIGLMKAVDRFDYRKGYRFSTYASWWIRHSISRALADKSRVIRIPVHMQEAINKANRTVRNIEALTGEKPSDDELALETGIKKIKLSKIKEVYKKNVLSLHREVNNGDDRLYIDTLEVDNAPSPFDILSKKDWVTELEKTMKFLTPLEAKILRCRFGLEDGREMTLKEIGDGCNLSRERIRQLQEQALCKVRKRIKD